MLASDLFEADQLTGYIDIRGLADLLQVDSFMNFANVIDKLRLGEDAHYTIPEMTTLAHAFITLISLDAPSKATVMHKLMSINAAPNAKPGQGQASRPAGLTTGSSA